MAEPRYTHDRATHNLRAARRVVPHLLEEHAPASVLDVGCGLGSWMAVFAEAGCRVRGIDGVLAPEELLHVPPEWIERVDLEGELEAGERVDLALCLEVAEHLTAPAGDRLVRFLTRSADVVVFSAAVPGQGGDHHLNERWPRYWQERFEAQGFSFEDTLRERFWDDEEVDWWYRQNLFVCRKGGAPGPPVRSLVHPRLLEKKARREEAFYQGEVPVRTGLLVLGRALLRRLGLGGGARGGPGGGRA